MNGEGCEANDVAGNGRRPADRRNQTREETAASNRRDRGERRRRRTAQLRAVLAAAVLVSTFGMVWGCGGFGAEGRVQDDAQGGRQAREQDDTQGGRQAREQDDAQVGRQGREQERPSPAIAAADDNNKRPAADRASSPRHSSLAEASRSPDTASGAHSRQLWSSTADASSRVSKAADRRAGKPIRAIYVTSYVANGDRMKGLTALVRETELNAMVLDVNSGISLMKLGRRGNKPVYLPSDSQASRKYADTIRGLKRGNIYLIARIVTFKNSGLAESVPSLAIRRKDGRLWRDAGGAAWIDPYKTAAWAYPLALAEYAVSLGFDEVQFDYVRFPDNAARVDREVTYANNRSQTKSEAIAAFLRTAAQRLRPSGTVVSADVFGLTGSTPDDMGIGQQWDLLVREVDVLSPMVYPSHYAAGIWGIRNPDLMPGRVVGRALKDAANRNRRLGERGVRTAGVRPWLQSFTAGWVHPHQAYGPQQIREQVAAARQAGYSSYMLWNAASRYPDF